jgi:uncharacterized protein
MRIGVISDTHGWLDPKTESYFKDCDQIWHAGDIGNLEVTDKLATFECLRNNPNGLKAVYGNIDDAKARIVFKEDLIFEVDNVKVLITHIAGAFGKYTPRVKELIDLHKPNILVCGHSHICKVAFDKAHKVLYMNPGAAGNHGFHHVKTLLRFPIEGDRIFDMEVIELGIKNRKQFLNKDQR